jgi:hypothetical protein
VLWSERSKLDYHIRLQTYPFLQIPYSADVNTPADLVGHLRTHIREQQGKEEKVDITGELGMREFLLKQSRESFWDYVKNYMVAVSMEKNQTMKVNLIGWFQYEALHTPAVALAIVDNTLLNHFVQDGQERKLEVTNHPLPPSNDSATESYANSEVSEKSFLFR